MSVLSATRITELRAINLMLSAAGQTPLPDLTGASLNVDATLCINLLQEVFNDFQAEGWWFNTRLGDMPVSGGVIPAVEPIIAVDTNDQGQTHVEIRKNNLWDLDRNTSAFTTGLINVKITELLIWDELPEVARLLIAKRAARLYVDRHVSDPQLVRLAREDEARALASFRRQETRSANSSVLDRTGRFISRQRSPLSGMSVK